MRRHTRARRACCTSRASRAGGRHSEKSARSSLYYAKWQKSWILRNFTWVDLNPSKKISTRIWVRNVRTDFSALFLDLVQKTCSGRFPYLFRLNNFFKAPRDMRKFPQKCQKIAGCSECAVYGSRPPIASKPGSSPLEWPGLDNPTSQPWSDVTCPCTTSSSTHFHIVTLFWFEKTRQSTRSSGTGASWLRPWLSRDIV